MLCRSLFPTGYNLVDHDPDLFLLHCHYYKQIDTLFVLYKRYSNGEKILRKIKNPKVPVFVSSRHRERHQEFIQINETRRYMVSYAKKEEEMIPNLFQAKIVRYQDKFTRQWIEKVIYPNVDHGAVALHPDVFFFDYPIEQIVYLEYTLSRYEQQGSELFENVPIPKLNVCAFDIETHRDENGDWNINTNTFVNPETHKAYIDIVKHPEFNRYDELVNNKEKYYKDVKDTLYEMIDNCSLSGKSKDFVQKLAREFVDKLDIELNTFDNEAEMITATCKRMFTDNQPDILTAFNAPFDVGTFQDRINILGLPAGTFNQHGIGFDDVKPPFDVQSRNENDEDRGFRGDDYNPTKRVVYMNNISHTLIADSQTTFFSNRSTQTFSNYKLDTVAQIILGFGKYDYTHITTSILNLARADFYYHSIYAIIDSILLAMLDLVTNDFESKLIYCMSCKVNIEESPRNNSAITRGIFADCVIRGDIPGNNINKICFQKTNEELAKLEKLLNIDYLCKTKYAVTHKGNYGGGIVLKPGLYNYDFTPYMEQYGILNGEADIKNFRRVLYAIYLDFKSHYPSQTVVCNLSKDTLLGNISKILDCDGNVIMMADRDAKSFSDLVHKHLGSVNLATLSRDTISFGHMCCNLPSINDLVQMVVKFDSEPKFNKEEPFILELPKCTPKQNRIISVLSSINTYNYKNHIGSQTDKSEDDEDDIINVDTKYFYLTNGELSFNGTYVRYEYPNYDIYNMITGNDNEMTYYGAMNKGIVTINNGKLNPIRNKPFDLSDCEMYNIEEIDWENMYESDVSTIRSTIFGGITTYINKYCFYFPWNVYKKQLIQKGLNQKILVSTPTYKLKKFQDTAVIGLYYSILGEDDLIINLEQQMQVVLVD